MAQGFTREDVIATNVAIQSFTASGTYTPNPRMAYCHVRTVGGGGAGGGAKATGSNNVHCGGGGGSGEYAEGIFTKVDIGSSQVVTIGTAGTASSGAQGGDGTATSLGALISANGGLGGASSSGTTIVRNANGRLGGSGGSGGDFRSPGRVGLWGYCSTSPPELIGGFGGNSFFGMGGKVSIGGVTNTGQNGIGYGAGGAGSSNFKNQSSITAGDGVNGFILITEFLV